MAEKEVQIAVQTGKNATAKSRATTKSVETGKSVGNSSSSGSSVSVVESSKSQGQSQNALTREIALALKDLNNNLNAQNVRLDKQEEQLQSLSERFTNYGEYDESESYDYDYQYDDTDTQSQSMSESESHGNSNSTNVFKSLVDKYQQVEPVDNEVNEDLATLVNNSFKIGLTDEKQSELIRDIHRPQNCDSLVKTRVNQGVWRLLKMHTQADDSRMQAIQDLIVKATSNIVKLVDKNGEKFDSEDMNWSSNAIALLGQTNKMINTRRKELHRSDLDPKYHYLASASLPFTELLYGDDTDVNKNVKEINDLNKIGRNLGRGGYVRGSSFRGYRRPHPYRRGNYRGRGQPRGSTTATKNAKTAFKK